MSLGNNVNETGFSKTHNVNGNNNGNVDTKYQISRKVDRIADQLVEKMGNSKYRAFYCKVALKLSEARIWQNYESAVAGAKNGDPGRLFTYLCKKDGV